MRLSHLYITHTLCDHGNRKVCDGLDGERLSFGLEMRLELLGRKGERPIHLTVPASHLFLSNLILLSACRWRNGSQCLQLLVVHQLTHVHDFAQRRVRKGRAHHQVLPALPRLLQSTCERHGSQLCATADTDANCRVSNLVVDFNHANILMRLFLTLFFGSPGRAIAAGSAGGGDRPPGGDGRRCGPA